MEEAMHTHVHSLSINAYNAHHASGGAESQGRRILAHIRERGGDWSIGELAAALGMDKSAVSARVHELLYDAEALVACPRRKDRVSGILVRPVTLAPTTQREA
jgi:DNA-binding transcriptional ArsR family regulator